LVGEGEEVKRLRPPFSTLLPVFGHERSEFQQPRFLGMQFQAELPPTSTATDPTRVSRLRAHGTSVAASTTTSRLLSGGAGFESRGDVRCMRGTKRERFSYTSPERKKLKFKRESTIFISASFVPSLFGWIPQSLLGPLRGRRRYDINSNGLLGIPVLQGQHACTAVARG